MTDIYLCVTLYHLYVSLLSIEGKKNRENSVLLLDANDPQIYSNFLKYEKNLASEGFIVDSHLRNKTKNIIGLETLEGNKQFKRIEEKLGRKIGEDFTLYNFAWNCQYAYSISTYFIKKCKKLMIMEEGAQTAFVPPQPSYKILIKKLTGNIVDFYKLRKLDGIYIQKPEIFPEQWGAKKKNLNLEVLTKKLSEESKNLIFKIFLGDLYSQFCEYDFSNAGIVYTQALSEDNYITEQEKINYYSQIVEYYKTYAMPVFKLHPRDKTKYPFDNEVLVLPASIPSEVLSLMGVKFKYAIAICSSAVLSTNSDVKINLNENFNNDKIFKLIPIEEVQK